MRLRIRNVDNHFKNSLLFLILAIDVAVILSFFIFSEPNSCVEKETNENRKLYKK